MGEAMVVSKIRATDHYENGCVHLLQECSNRSGTAEREEMQLIVTMAFLDMFSAQNLFRTDALVN